MAALIHMDLDKQIQLLIDNALKMGSRREWWQRTRPQACQTVTPLSTIPQIKAGF